MLSNQMCVPLGRAQRAFARFVGLSLTLALPGFMNCSAQAQQATGPSSLPTINVQATSAANDVANPLPANAYQAPYQPPPADLGPLGLQKVADTPQSVTIVPESLIENAEAQTANDFCAICHRSRFAISKVSKCRAPNRAVSKVRSFRTSVLMDSIISARRRSPAKTSPASKFLTASPGALYGPEIPFGRLQLSLEASDR